ncbi:hypothetical protein OYT88_16050 [Sporolactobacillus sp. CQH2019]|uniref:hypothetical protein n=1 Tax=Sporolactobacillus sp. CQH2019 TaxID=3023512 RepID=UPI002368C2C6|nr:hypothetical protein [Sporolactobacillus sp. CQH2019]MDD9150055.1 hypothetical protein [Sporolactobacillus sp. CQH2019]
MKKFFIDLYQIRPSQLFLDQDKVDRLKDSFDPLNIRGNMPLPIRRNGGEFYFADGHARAFLYDLNKISLIPVFLDEDDSDADLYQIRLKWCREQGIVFISDLKERILPHGQFETRWTRRCRDEAESLEKRL